MKINLLSKRFCNRLPRGGIRKNHKCFLRRQMLKNLWENHNKNGAVRFGWNLKCLRASCSLCGGIPSEVGTEKQLFLCPRKTIRPTPVRYLLHGPGLLYFPACLEVHLINDQSGKGFFIGFFIR